MDRRPALLIVSDVRSGGTVLFNALGRHSRLLVAGELFDFSENAYWRKKRRELAALASVSDEIGPLSDVIPVIRQAYRHYNGFVLHRVWQLAQTNQAWSYLAGLPSLRVIHLHRRNVLEQFVSALLANQSRVWHLEADREVAPPVWQPLSINVPQCVETMRTWRRHLSWSLDLFRACPHLVFAYEDLEADLAGTLVQCQEFLGVPVEPLKPGYKKLPPKDLRKLILNYEVLADELARTEFADLIPA